MASNGSHGALSTDVEPTDIGAATAGVPVDPNEERIRKWREERLRIAEDAKKERALEKKRVAEDAAMQRVPTLDQIEQTRRNILKQRRQRRMWMGVRLAAFVLLPTLIGAFYYFVTATPLYRSEAAFIVQTSKAEGISGSTGLFGQGPVLDTIKETMAVRHFVQSQTLMQKMEDEKGFMSHFAGDDVDSFTRLGSSLVPWRDELEYYNRRVEIALDPVEGILKLNVYALSPEHAQSYARAVIGYSEQMVNTLSDGVRESQLELANRELETTETRLKDARAALINYKGGNSAFDPIQEAANINAVISGLETELARVEAELAAARSIGQRNKIAQMEAARDAVQDQIAKQRERLQDVSGGLDLQQFAARQDALQADIDIAQQRYEQALEAYNRARIEASEQLKFIATVVDPTMPFAQAAPEPVFDTMVVFLVALGLYSIATIFIGALREHSRI
ncbi:MAG: hypothetical protein MRY63_02470 [Neomegalonema sp.]|nr:hypothetical protein [Neomegalonema sp.]